MTKDQALSIMRDPFLDPYYSESKDGERHNVHGLLLRAHAAVYLWFYTYFVGDPGVNREDFQ